MRNKKILIVDDDRDLTHILRVHFESQGYDVILAGNGKEGVDLATSQVPDLIVMDIMLPVMDGLEATRLIREHPNTHSTPILAMTAKVTEQDKKDCFQSGCNDHIGKPFTARQLTASIERLLNPKGTSDTAQLGTPSLDS